MTSFGWPRLRGCGPTWVHRQDLLPRLASNQRTVPFRSFSHRSLQAAARRLRAAAFCIFCAVAAATVMAACGPARAEGPQISHFSLDNGLEVVVIPDHRTPVVTHMVWYKVGSADEQAGKSGLAHFLEHLMFKGTDKNPQGRFSETLATIGGQENAFTTADYTGYFQRIAREYLPTVMEFEADRMTGLVLTEANVPPERDVVLEEYNMRVANSPEARLGEQVAAALYLNHPYGRPVIGWRPELEKLNREDALAFYRRFYTPNNAVLVIAGDVTVDEVRRLAEKTYGKVAARAEIGPRMRPQEPAPVAVRQVTLADPRVAQPSLQRSYLVPSSTTGKAGEPEALEVLAHVLGNGETSRLYRSLVVEQHLATNAGGWYQGTAARRGALRRLRQSAAGGHVRHPGGGARRRDRRNRRAWDCRRRARSGEDPAGGRCGLRPGQSGHHGAMVRRRAHHRGDDGAGDLVAQARPRGDRRCGTRRCPRLA